MAKPDIITTDNWLKLRVSYEIEDDRALRSKSYRTDV
uniref:Uncharacterized protein n=1 Tax=Anguilla anguilla TaxID=7936 RepID=A0A0E9QK95_ANGAN